MSKELGQDSDYFAVQIDLFRNAMRDISFDVFLRLSEDNFAHVFSKTTGLDYQRLAQYMDKGVSCLFVRNEDQESFEAFMSRTPEEFFNCPDVTQEQKVATLLNMTEQNMAELFNRVEVDPAAAEKSKVVVREYVNLLISHPKSLANILALVSHGEYLYYHSIATAIFGLLIAQSMGTYDEKTMEVIGLGGFLHDIGCTKISRLVAESPDELSTDQWQEMKEHPRLGMKMIQDTPNIPEEVKYVVYQHHEYPSSKGYPNQLNDRVIYYPAKVVAVADSFSALISDRPFRKAYSVDDAIEIMKKEEDKFEQDIVDLLPSIFMRETLKKKAS